MRDAVRRNLVNYVIMVLLVAAAYFAGRAQYQHERHDRIVREKAALVREQKARHKLQVAACRDRVTGRDAIRLIVVQAYAPPSGTSDDRAALYAARRDEVLAKVPPLHCVGTNAVPVK